MSSDAICPNCGVPKQPGSNECPACGIVFSRYEPQRLAARRAARHGQGLPGGTEAPAGELPDLPPPPGPLPTGIDPYAPPRTRLTAAPPAASAGGVWREGKEIRLRPGAVLPARCLRCNQPVETSLRRKLYWHPPGWYLLILVNLLLYALVALAVRRKAELDLPVCPLHRARRRLHIAIGWVAGLGGFALIFVGIAVDNGWVFLAAFLSLLFGLFYGPLASRIVYPARIDPELIRLRGADPAYLAALPAGPGGAG